MTSPREAAPDRVELNLLPPFVKNASTDAEMRMYLEDTLVRRTQEDFRHLNLTEDDLKPYAAKAIRKLRLEFDVNIERVQSEDAPLLDSEKLAQRYQILGFKFQRFLDSLRQVEDEEFARAQREAQTIATAEKAAERLGSGEFSTLNQGKTVLPTDLVAHMFKVGIEAHLLMVRKLMFGDRHLGVRVTFHELKVVQANAGQVRPTSAKAARALRALSPSGPQTVGSETLRIMCGCCVSAFKSMYEAEDESFDVLKSLSGAVEPGKATLLLGPPHAGKTSLFHALSGRTTNTRRYSGEVFYNGHSTKEVHPPNFVTVVDQTDLHIPILTVRETLEFAYHCRGKLSREALQATEDPEAARNIAKSRVNLVLATLGLLRVADTPIGNEFIKGVSGGEMRRVTLGEMLVVGAKVLLLDEISTGLDSAATLDISKAIRAMCRVFDLTVVVSLLQPPPETYEVFDDVLLMGAGNILYHGPRAEILPFLMGLGLTRPDNVDVADFLVDTAFAQPEKVLEGFRATPHYANSMALATSEPAALHTDHPLENRLIQASRYKRSWLSMLRVVTMRQWIVISRNTAFIKARVAQNVIMGLLLGALFFAIPFNQWYLISMVLMQVLSFMSFGTIAILPDVVAVRNVFYKQARENFFSPASYAVADYAVGLPFSCFDGFVLGSIVYFMANLSLSNNGGPYFVYLVICISYNVCMAQVIRYFAYTAPDRTMATAFAVLFLVMSIMFSGAVATPQVIPPWFIWIYWAFSPMAWAYRSLLQNELLSTKYQANDCVGCPNQNAQCVWYCPSAPNCAAPYPSELCGDYFLTSRQVLTDPAYLWAGVGMLWGYTLVFLCMSVVSLKFLRHDQAGKREVMGGDALLLGNKGQEDGPQDPEAGPHQAQQATEPKTLAWRNIVYTIDLPIKDEDDHDTRRKMRRHRDVLSPVELLKSVSGFARPFEMLALMGSSGAGKTTLLDVLAFRKTLGRVSAQFALGGVNLQGAQFKRVLGYVEQFGVHAEKSTVRESLEFSALLRLPPSTTPAQRSAVCDLLVKMLELGPIEHMLIGSADRGGLSFEENKRVTIAVELVSGPSVVFADEPTSGLTSREALVTMRALSRVCMSGRAVICTIHQPSAAVFEIFQRLLMLRRGGQVTYFGPISGLQTYFEAVPGVRPLPAGQNPATWMLEIQGAGTSGAVQTIDFAEAYAFSGLARENQTILDGLMPPPPESEEELSVDLHMLHNAEYTQSNATQLSSLLRRQSLTYWRSPTYSLLRWLIQLFFAIIAGTTFLLQPLNNAAAVQSRVGIINMMLILLGNYNGNVIIPFVFQRRALFYRERASNMYTAWSFTLSEQLVEDPYVVFEVMLSVVVFYFLVGMVPAAAAFFYYAFLVFLYTEFATFNAMLWCGAMPGPGPATLLSTLVLQISVLFSGISVPGNQLASWLLGFYYLSPARWACEGLISTQFQLYNDVMCYTAGTPTTWAVGSPLQPKFCGNSTVAPVLLPDVNLTACCNPVSSLPISARNYVLYGQTYANNVTIPAFLGGPNGYQYAWRYWDLLFVSMAMLVVRFLGIWVASTMTHQKSTHYSE